MELKATYTIQSRTAELIAQAVRMQVRELTNIRDGVVLNFNVIGPPVGKPITHPAFQRAPEFVMFFSLLNERNEYCPIPNRKNLPTVSFGFYGNLDEHWAVTLFDISCSHGAVVKGHDGIEPFVQSVLRTLSATR